MRYVLDTNILLHYMRESALSVRIDEQYNPLDSTLHDAIKAQRLAALADQVWDENGWTQETMQTFLNTHMRTPYLSFQKQQSK